MTLWLIAAMTLIAFVMLNAWFSERRITLSRTGDVFMLTWFYYGFAVAIDILMGLEIQRVPGMTNFSDDASRRLLIEVLGYYLMCGAAFCVAYACIGTSRRTLPTTRPVVLPPVSLIIIAHVVLLSLQVRFDYLNLTRSERILLIADSLPLRLLMLSDSLLRAMDLVIIILSTQKKHVVVTTVAALCLGLASGGRMELMSVALILLLKYRMSCGRLRFAAAIVALLGAFAGWKSIHQYASAQLNGTEAGHDTWEYTSTSLSGIESYASSLVAVTAVEGECPYYYGKTYTYDVLQAALPGEWRDTRFLPLSQAFDWDYLPHLAEQGISMAFSAIAEAWLNFGVVGPILLGLAFGVAAKVIDSGRRGVVFYVFALMTFRLFRSDFASLCKNWIVIYGGAMCACFLACMLLTHLLDSRRRNQRAVRRLLQPSSVSRQTVMKSQSRSSQVSNHAI